MIDLKQRRNEAAREKLAEARSLAERVEADVLADRISNALREL